MTGMILGLRQPDMTETPKNRMIMEKILSKNTHTSSLAGRKHPRITLTAEDNDRLSSLVRAAMDKMPDIASCLADELDRASVLPKGRVAADTVRMGSHLEYRDEHWERSGRQPSFTLTRPTFPRERSRCSRRSGLP